MYFTSYGLFKLQNAGPHVSAIIFIIMLSLESVEEWLMVCCVEKKIGVFISSNICYFNVETVRITLYLKNISV